MYTAVDLHCHSHCSDGSLSPQSLCERALQAGVQLLALTDHDTTAGLTALHAAARGSSLQVVNGVELSVRWKSYDIHILGLRIALDNLDFNTCLAAQATRRTTRALEISQRLSATLGLQDVYQKALAIAGHERVGRPHFAQVLLQAGLVTTMQQAFKKFLLRGRPAYVPIAWISLEEAVSRINQAGGVAVIAHPLKYQLTRSKLHELIRTFKAYGGLGLEVVSGVTSVMGMNDMAGLCLRYDLLASSGSDYHGDGVSSVALGRQMPLPPDCTALWHTLSLL